MSEELMEIQRGVASLKKDVEKLRRLQSDCVEAKKLLKKLVGTEFD
jgi:prefoldin subunit 5